jgi:hypothetical protein
MGRQLASENDRGDYLSAADIGLFGDWRVLHKNHRKISAVGALGHCAVGRRGNLGSRIRIRAQPAATYL